MSSPMFERPAWERFAPCSQPGVDPDWWFPPQGNNGFEAKTICALCPFKAPCLAGALARKERYGIYAGVAVGRRYKGRLDEVAA